MRRQGWRYPSAKWVESARRKAARESQLSPIIEGRVTSTDAAELREAAILAHRRRLYVSSVRLHRAARAADATAVAVLDRRTTYLAAQAAGLAAAGAGPEAAGLDEIQRRAMRDLAFGWLNEHLETWRKAAAEDGSWVPARLRHVLTTRDLEGLRSPAAVLRLPEVERARWRHLWREYDRLVDEIKKPG